VGSCPPEVITTLADYILYPIFQLKSKKDIELQLELILKVLEYSESKNIAQQLLIQLPTLGFQTEDDDMRLNIARIFEMLYRRIEYDNSLEFQLGAAHIVTLMIHFLHQKSFMRLKLQSLDTLLMIFNVIGNPDRIAQLLPGVVSGLSKLLIGNPTENHKVLIRTLQVLKHILLKTLSDDLCDNLPTEDVSTENLFQRNRDWLDNTAKNISKIFNLLMPLLHHQHPDVQSEYTLMCFSLYNACHWSLRLCRDDLLDCILYTHSSLNPRTTLDTNWFSSLPPNDRLKTSINLHMQERLAKKLNNFKVLARSTEDSKRVEAFRILHGLLGLLGKDSHAVFEVTMKEFVSSLLWLFEADLSHIGLIETYSSTELNLDQFGSTDTIVPFFSHFQSGDVIKSFEDLCTDMNDLVTDLTNEIISHLCVPDEQFAAIFLLNRIMKSQKNGHLSEKVIMEYLKLDCLNMAVNFEDYQVHKSIVQGFSMEPTIPSFNNVISKTALVMDGLAISASSMDSSQLTCTLMEGLYVMLEKFGSPNYHIQNSAKSALLSFAKELQRFPIDQLLPCPLINVNPSHSLLAKLVLYNVDYIVESVSHKLRYVTENPMAAKVLVASIRLAGPDLVGPLLFDSIDQILDILDTFGSGGRIDWTSDSENGSVIVLELIKVFLAMFQLLSKSKVSESQRISHQNAPNVPLDLGSRNSEISQEMTEFFLRHQPKSENDQPKESAEAFFRRRAEERKADTVPNDEQDMSAPDIEESDTVELSENETVCKKILVRLFHFLSSDTPQIRKCVLECLRHGLVVLKNVPSAMNPLIHQIWPLLILKCNDTVPFVAVEALELVGYIAQVSPEFVRQRVQKDILDNLLKLLEQLQLKATNSVKAKFKPPSTRSLIMHEYTTSQDWQLYQTIFNTLDSILRGVHLKLDQHIRLCYCLVNFLNSNVYSKEVIEKSIQLLLKLGSRCRDWLWLVLLQALGSDVVPIRNDTLAIPPHIVKPVGNALDFYHCKELFKLFSNNSFIVLKRQHEQVFAQFTR
jgi:hypothetical protein